MYLSGLKRWLTPRTAYCSCQVTKFCSEHTDGNSLSPVTLVPRKLTLKTTLAGFLVYYLFSKVISFPFSVIRYKSFPLYLKENARIIIEHISFSTFTAAFKRNYSIFLTIECKILKTSFHFLHIWQCDATKTVGQGSTLCYLPTPSQGFFT